jgi:hypothetical protein
VKSQEGMEGKLLGLLDDAAVLGQRCKWELQSKSVSHRQMLERDEIEAYMDSWQKQSVSDRLTTVLTTPTIVLSGEHCHTLRRTLRAVKLGQCKQPKLRQATKNEDSKEKVVEETFESRYNL